MSTRVFCDVCGSARDAMFVLSNAPRTKGAQDLMNQVDSGVAAFKEVDICDACLQTLVSAEIVGAIVAKSKAAQGLA